MLHPNLQKAVDVLREEVTDGHRLVARGTDDLIVAAAEELSQLKARVAVLEADLHTESIWTRKWQECARQWQEQAEDTTVLRRSGARVAELEAALVERRIPSRRYEFKVLAIVEIESEGDGVWCDRDGTPFDTGLAFGWMPHPSTASGRELHGLPDKSGKCGANAS